MLGKSIAIISVQVSERDPTLQALIANISGLHWKLQGTKVLPCNSLILISEIESSIKQNELSILIGEYTNEVANSLTDVFHQNSIAVNIGQVPKHARFLDRPHDTILYLQGLIVIPFGTCDIHTTFENVLKPFLSSMATNNCKSFMPLVARLSTSFHCKEVYNSHNSVYEFARYKHVRKSIESIEKCLADYHPACVFVSFNGGKDCMVLLHMLLAVLKKNYLEYSTKTLCLYVESVDSFKEINDFVSECESCYNLEVIKIRTSTKDALADILNLRPYLKACLMGTRRTDPFSEHLEIFQMTDSDWPQVMRVCPLLDWHYSEIWDYLLTLRVPYCKLYDLGYTSLGNVNNTMKNPLLRCGENQSNTYLPAYKLLDASYERQGRSAQSDKVIKNSFVKS